MLYFLESISSKCFSSAWGKKTNTPRLLRGLIKVLQETSILCALKYVQHLIKLSEFSKMKDKEHVQKLSKWMVQPLHLYATINVHIILGLRKRFLIYVGIGSQEKGKNKDNTTKKSHKQIANRPIGIRRGGEPWYKERSRRDR